MSVFGWVVHFAGKRVDESDAEFHSQGHTKWKAKRDMSEYKNWTFEEADHVARLTIQRPARRNALTSETLHELKDLSDRVRSDKDIWVVILQGSGDHFSVGIDLDLLRSRLDQPVEENRAFLRDQQVCIDAFDALQKPSIAKIQGFCIGGGLILALCCDFRIVGQRSVFSLPEVKLGLPVLWGTKRVTRTVGMPAAKELILLGKRINAERAVECGLVHQAVSEDELDAAVDNLAEKFLTLPPRTIALANRIIDKGLEQSLPESEELEIEALADLLGSSDLNEAIDSYLQKRPPIFSGE
jgi:enoyl-CoA hydratase/carnithine racemase